MSVISQLANMPRRATITWGALVLATLVSWWLADEYQPRPGNAALVGAVLILTIAFAKIRFIGQEFMGLRTAPPALKIIFDLWVIGVWGILVGFYLVFGAQR